MSVFTLRRGLTVDDVLCVGTACVNAGRCNGPCEAYQALAERAVEQGPVIDLCPSCANRGTVACGACNEYDLYIEARLVEAGA